MYNINKEISLILKAVHILGRINVTTDRLNEQRLLSE
jgi:hypothetical protein